MDKEKLLQILENGKQIGISRIIKENAQQNVSNIFSQSMASGSKIWV